MDNVNVWVHSCGSTRAMEITYIYPVRYMDLCVLCVWYVYIYSHTYIYIPINIHRYIYTCCVISFYILFLFCILSNIYQFHHTWVPGWRSTWPCATKGAHLGTPVPRIGLAVAWWIRLEISKSTAICREWKHINVKTCFRTWYLIIYNYICICFFLFLFFAIHCALIYFQL